MGESVALGEALPDHFDPLAAFVGSHISQLGDIAGHLEEYAAIEREYAGKVQALVRRTRAARDRRIAELCVGPSPTRSWNAADPSNKSTAQTFLTAVLDSQEATATAHDALAEALGSVVADLSRTQTQDDAVLKAHVDTARKLRASRDEELHERVRAKSEYEEATQVVETQRHRVEKREASGGSSDKAQKSKAAAEQDMKNAKNEFLVAIATANEANAHYFARSVPALEEGLQHLWSLGTAHLASRLQRANAHFLTLAERTRSYVDDVDKAVAGVDAGRDQALYARFNTSTWAGPEQWAFEPFPTFYDTPDWVTDEDAHALLENRLIRARQQLRDVSPQAERALAAYDAAARMLTQPDVETLQHILSCQYPLLSLQLKESCLLIEDATLTAVAGDVAVEARPHAFKPTTFKIPTSCVVCSSSLWGLNKQAVQCQACNTAAHSKCALRLPPECSKSTRKSGALARVHTTGSTYSTRSASTRSSAKAAPAPAPPPTTPPAEPVQATPPAPLAESEPAPAPAQAPPTQPEPTQKVPGGLALYAFEASGAGELDLEEGEALTLVAPDEGSGWTKVANMRGETGHVPSSYVEFAASVTGSAHPTASAPTTASGTAGVDAGGLVRALYDFEASAADELPLVAGELVALTPLGRGVANGWIEGVNPRGGTGIFPASYVEDVQ